MSETRYDQISAEKLAAVVSAIFQGCGLEAEASTLVGEDLVAADVEGVASHGVMLVPMYVKRLKAGSVSTSSSGRVVVDQDAVVVLDAGNVLGQLTARQAVALATERAGRFGLSAVAVRNAFHFGTAGRYARMIADCGCIGIVMSNTRPLMPAPGGAQALTGNNPIAIAAPASGEFHPEVDMALSAVAMGKIRNAATAGATIPKGWAVDKEGAATTDPLKAIEGMLLPAAGPKGFGLAFMVDLISGGLSGGSIGAEVNPLYGSADKPYSCSNFFIAINVAHFVTSDQFGAKAASEIGRVNASKRAPGVHRIYAPGELAYAARHDARGTAKVAISAIQGLIEVGNAVGVDVVSLLK
ncbi:MULTISPECIES: Ldh family oxidoreductase [unclassified Rhizobium]|uniref:Ldh family oxidoreductase n=1 Tax=unclassified Rhizobium TaxID=2613769 RepID=UPI00288BEFBA|nr:MULTISPECIES: Ldh family oxidoreductase [unclassified Rhizobium]